MNVWQQQGTKDDDLACQWTCHVVQMVMTCVIVTVHNNSGEQLQSPPSPFFTQEEAVTTGNQQWMNDEEVLACQWACHVVHINTGEQHTPPPPLLRNSYIVIVVSIFLSICL